MVRSERTEAGAQSSRADASTGIDSGFMIRYIFLLAKKPTPLQTHKSGIYLNLEDNNFILRVKKV